MFRASRLLLAALCAAGCLFALTANAQNKKVVIHDPKDLKDDKDFAAQGEYLGESKDGKEKWGAQVIARGDGKFDVKFLKGGLPGDGWDGKTTTMAKGVTKESTVEITEGDKVVSTLAAGVITNADPKGFPLKRVERKSKTMGEKAPSGADVLYAEPGDESKWNGGKVIELSDGKFLNRGIKTKKLYGSFKAHIEFRLPWMPGSTGQGRGNSGFYLQDRYELQILDSFGLKGENNECGGIYTLHKPSVNMCLPPMVWQTYDIDFTAAEFDGDKKTKPARVTVLHNGVKIQDDVELKGPTGGGQPESSKPGAIQLQDHGDPLVFRNAWIVEKK